MALYEDAPPDLLAGRMDLQVILPEGEEQKVSVPRSTAMLDLRVQLTTSRKLSPSAFSLQPLGPAGETLPFQPSTPVGALDVWSVRLLPKTRGGSSVPVKRAAPGPIPVAPGAPAPGAPSIVTSAGGGSARTLIAGPGPPSFEQTFRLQVHLPRNQLFVTRASSRVLLGDVLQLACQEKNLDPSKYEIRHPANLDQRLSPEATLGECNLTEVALVPAGARQPDTPALLRQEARRREAAHRGTGPAVSAHYPYVIPHTAGTEGSVSSMSSGGRSASPAPSDGSSVDRSSSPPQALPPQTLPPPASTKVPFAPNRPGRKRRPAPKPPGPPAKELNNNVCAKEANPAPVISHSRNSSDSSGYHEASVLSESPEGGTSCGTESLPNLAPRGKTELSQSMTNLSLAPVTASKMAPKTALVAGTNHGMGKRNGHSASTSALFSEDGGGRGSPGRQRLFRVWSFLKGGHRKKKAPPPPPPVTSTPSTMKESASERFLKTQSLERIRPKSSTLPAMSSAPPMTLSPVADAPVADAPVADAPVADPSLVEKPLPPSMLPPFPRPPSAEPPQHLPPPVRVGTSSGSQIPTPTPSEVNSGSLSEESLSRHESMPYDGSLSNEHYDVIHEEGELVPNVSSDGTDSAVVTPPTPVTPDTAQETPSDVDKVTNPTLIPDNRNLSVSSNDTVYLTPNCTKNGSTFLTPEGSSINDEEWHYLLPSPPSAFRDTRSRTSSPITSNPKATAAPPAEDADDICSDVTSRTGTSSHSDEEIERITRGGSIASDESPPMSPVERPKRASPILRSGPMSLTGTAAMLSELSQVISEQRKEKSKRANTLEYPKCNAVSESRLNNFSMSTYSRPQSALSIISPEVKPSLVIARRSSFNNGACSTSSVSVRRTTSHATLSGSGSGLGLSAGQSATGKELFRGRIHEAKPLGRATSDMNLNSGLPATLQLDPEQASLLDEFMEWRRQQRLKKQAQTNQNGGSGTDIRAKFLEDDVQSLQMFQNLLNRLEATERGSSDSTLAEPKEQEAVKGVPTREASPISEVSASAKDPKETIPSPMPEARPEFPVEEVVLREKANSSATGRPRMVVSGPPTIQMSTWNERPKRQVSIKLDRDYWVGVGAAGLRRTDVLPGLVQVEKSLAPTEVDSGPESRPAEDSPAIKPALETRLIAQKSDVSRLPIVRAVELKKTVSDQSTRTLTNSVVYLSASDDSSVKAVSVAGPTSNKSNKFTSVVDISRPAVSPDASVSISPASVNGSVGGGVCVNGVVPQVNQTKRNLPMPVVKPFKLNAMTRQLSAPNSTPIPPPPPPVPPTMPTLKKVVRPQSLPAKALDPRDQLLEAIRNFGGRTNLRPT